MDVKTHLERANQQQRKMAETSATIMIDIKAVEAAVGVAPQLKPDGKQSSSTMHQRLVALEKALRAGQKRQLALHRTAWDLVGLRKKLEEQDLDTVFEQSGGMLDRKQILTLSNTKVKGCEVRPASLASSA